MQNEYQSMTSVMAMNRMPFAANVAGNHIFDYPLDVIKKQASAAQFPLLSANILAVETGKVAEPFQPYSLLARNGLTIGVVGLTTGRNKNQSFPGQPERIEDIAAGAGCPAVY